MLCLPTASALAARRRDEEAEERIEEERRKEKGQVEVEKAAKQWLEEAQEKMEARRVRLGWTVSLRSATLPSILRLCSRVGKSSIGTSMPREDAWRDGKDK